MNTLNILFSLCGAFIYHPIAGKMDLPYSKVHLSGGGIGLHGIQDYTLEGCNNGSCTILQLDGQKTGIIGVPEKTHVETYVVGHHRLYGILGSGLFTETGKSFPQLLRQNDLQLPLGDDICEISPTPTYPRVVCTNPLTMMMTLRSRDEFIEFRWSPNGLLEKSKNPTIKNCDVVRTKSGKLVYQCVLKGGVEKSIVLDSIGRKISVPYGGFVDNVGDLSVTSHKGKFKDDSLDFFVDKKRILTIPNSDYIISGDSKLIAYETVGNRIAIYDYTANKTWEVDASGRMPNHIGKWGSNIILYTGDADRSEFAITSSEGFNNCSEHNIIVSSIGPNSEFVVGKQYHGGNIVAAETEYVPWERNSLYVFRLDSNSEITKTKVTEFSEHNYPCIVNGSIYVGVNQSQESSKGGP